MGKKVPKRRAWRKVKIDDVEDAVESERLVAKLRRKKSKAGADAEKGQDEEQDHDEDGDLADLFTVDTAGSGEGLSQRARREIARAKLFPPKGPNIGLSASEQAKVERAAAAAKVQQPVKKNPEVFDLWGQPAEAPQKSPFGAIRSRKYVPASVPKTLHQKVGLAPAVVPAHEGQSLNPELGAYEDLACNAAARELERERRDEELDRKMRPLTHELRDMAGAEAMKDVDDSKKVELYYSLKGQKAAREGVEPASAHVRHRQKSQAQMNRAAKKKIADEMVSHEVRQKRLEKSVGEVGSILKEMKEKSEQSESRKRYHEGLKAEKRRLEETEGVVSKRRQLGRSVFEERAVVVPDVETAKKGLRAARIKDSAIHERLASIMRRGLLPATPEGSKSELVRHSKRNGRLKRNRKYLSPLLRGGDMLRK